MSRPRIAACVEVAGDAVSGIVLYRLLFWWPKASVDVDGRKFFAKSYDELQTETGLSFKQVKTALMKLRNRGLIITHQRDFSGKNVTHFMLTARCVEDLQLAQMGQLPKQKSADQLAQTGQPSGPKWANCDVPNGTTPYIQGGLHGEIQGDIPALTCGKDCPGHDPGLGENGESMAKAADILATTKWGKKHKTDTASELAFAWKQAVSEEYGGMVHLTQKQVGQLKHMIPKVGEGKAADVIRWTVSHWIEFVKTVETEVGVKSTPSKPSVDFLLKHASIAANLYEHSSKPGPSKQEATGGIFSAESVQLISQQDEDVPQSMEELLAILNDE